MFVGFLQRLALEFFLPWYLCKLTKNPWTFLLLLTTYREPQPFLKAEILNIGHLNCSVLDPDPYPIFFISFTRIRIQHTKLKIPIYLEICLCNIYSCSSNVYLHRSKWTWFRIRIHIQIRIALDSVSRSVSAKNTRIRNTMVGGGGEDGLL